MVTRTDFDALDAAIAARGRNITFSDKSVKRGVHGFQRLGAILEFEAAPLDVTAGELILIGAMVVLPLTNADRGEPFKAAARGVFLHVWYTPTEEVLVFYIGRYLKLSPGARLTEYALGYLIDRHLVARDAFERHDDDIILEEVDASALSHVNRQTLIQWFHGRGRWEERTTPTPPPPRKPTWEERMAERTAAREHGERMAERARLVRIAELDRRIAVEKLERKKRRVALDAIRRAEILENRREYENRRKAWQEQRRSEERQELTIRCSKQENDASGPLLEWCRVPPVRSRYRKKGLWDRYLNCHAGALVRQPE